MQSTFPARGGNSFGFTLLELLITVTILGVVMLIVVAALRISIQAWEKGGEKVTRRQAPRAIVDLMRRQLHSTLLLRIEENGQNDLLFSGAEDELEYVSLASAFQWKRTAANLVTYKVVGEEGEKSLMIRERRVQSHGLFEKKRPGDNASWRVLAKGFNEFSFQYTGAPRQQDEIGWVHKWDAAKRHTLPAAVKLVFDIASDSLPLEVIIRLPDTNS